MDGPILCERGGAVTPEESGNGGGGLKSAETQPAAPSVQAFKMKRGGGTERGTVEEEEVLVMVS